MKYRKHEAKEYAREALRGIWDSLGTPFTPEGEEGLRADLKRAGLLARAAPGGSPLGDSRAGAASAAR